ncbi:MAG: hypothetical protein IPK64_15040 [bacterium]|nr:hypothetical protein [bacterium]
MRRLMILCLILAAMVALSSCAPARSGTFTVASTTCGADALGAKYVLVKKNATAVDSKPIFLFQLGMPRDYAAISKILKENNGDLLTNVRIYPQTTLFLFLFGSAKVTVSADVWRRATVAELADPDGRPLLSREDLGDAAALDGTPRGDTL